MSDRCFVDTNILVYAHDRAAGSKHISARELLGRLWDSGDGALSTQVLQEFCVVIQRCPIEPLSSEELRWVVEDYLRWKIVVNTPESVLHALDLKARYQLSFWDALILHAAEECGASVLYSEDFSSGRAYGPLRVINPFVGSEGD